MPRRPTPRPAAPMPAYIVARPVLGGRQAHYLTAIWAPCPVAGTRRPLWTPDSARAHIYRTARGASDAAARWGGKAIPADKETP